MNLLKFPKKDRIEECLKTVMRETRKDDSYLIHDEMMVELCNFYTDYDHYLGDAIIVKIVEMRALMEEFWDEDD